MLSKVLTRLPPPTSVLNLRGVAVRAVLSQNMTTTWSGVGTQEDFMMKDECILVDGQDKIIGHGSKYDCHRFLPSQPSGILHRAFSVFLFSPDGKLLLQKRAASKVTFPSVWTNTCCSHQLYGQEINEVDTEDSINIGLVPGSKAAAIRKLQHELGIPAEELSNLNFKFLTRLHYCAADTMTWGENAEWGEHEVDYILFVRVEKPITLAHNPDEIDECKYVTHSELKEMMTPGNGLLWSPWFRIIAETFLDKWWQDLDATLTTDAHVDWKSIHSILSQ